MRRDESRVIDDAFLADQVRRVLAAADTAAATGRRFLLGIAGIPGAGKSTLAQHLTDRLNRTQPGSAVLAPMDGYHLTNARLDEMGWRAAKGAPRTFDFERYLAFLRAAADRSISPPVFVYDRQAHEPVRAGDAAHQITSRTSVVVTEGNLLLVDAPPWRQLAGLLSECWWLQTPIGVARRWLLARHERGGRSVESATAHYQAVDAANTALAIERQRQPDLCLRWPDSITSPDASD